MTEADWLAGSDLRRMLDFVGARATDRKLRLFACACCRRVGDSLLPEGRDAVAMAERFADGAATDVERNSAFYTLTFAEGGEWVREPTGSCCAFVHGLDSGTIAAALAVMADTEWLCDRMTGRALWIRGSERAILGRTHKGCEEAAALAAFRSLQARQAQRGPAGRAWHELVRVVSKRPWEWPKPEEYEREHIQQRAILRDVFGNPFRPVCVDPRWLTSDVIALAQHIYAERAFDRLPILADALLDAGCENADLLDHCRDPQLTHVRGCWVVDLLLGRT